MLDGFRFLKRVGRSERRTTKQPVPASGSSLHHRRLFFEPLEGRVLLTAVVVNTAADITDPSGSLQCSLRDAVIKANSSATPTTITFDPIVFATAQTIALNSSLILNNTSQPTTITAPAAGVTVSSESFNINFNVTATVLGVTFLDAGVVNYGTMTLNGVAVSGSGYTVNLTPEYDAIDNYGTATLTGVTVTGQAMPCGVLRGIFNSPGKITMTAVSVSGASDGGMVNQGTATLTNVNFSGNQAGVYAGGIFNGGNGTATLNDVTVSGNTGCGIENYGATISITNSTVSNNSGAPDGGGIYNNGMGILNLTDSTISGNTLSGEGLGGGLYNSFRNRDVDQRHDFGEYRPGRHRQDPLLRRRRHLQRYRWNRELDQRHHLGQ